MTRTFRPIGLVGRSSAPCLVLRDEEAAKLLAALGLSSQITVGPGELLSRLHRAKNQFQILPVHRLSAHAHYVMSAGSYGHRPAPPPLGMEAGPVTQPLVWPWLQSHRERFVWAGRLRALTAIAEWAADHRRSVTW